ncbi:hypothetical protein [Candidatus Hydrogenosomobacter endosymbioticus]|uniref:ATPase subunit I n=1 Tax=Candidatus Hydrogenosomobacter endosymbioticus TaxID=2558174 RepID=A0ABM7V8B2_9PROT|nr:hypothetical protein [Candidatus Hydrogenosomobacter endosymbioticus]BDB96015.1 hypothetical protein HYD_1480 [Candidatus Hydrogenosomobacter endosymbioticus]
MPQLDPVFYPSVLFWLFVSFALSLVLMQNLVLPRFFLIKKRREDKVRDLMLRAEKIQRSADEAKEIVEYAEKGAKAAVDKIIEEASEACRSKYDEYVSDLDAAIEKRLFSVQKHLENERKIAMRDSESLAKSICGAIVESNIGIKDANDMKNIGGGAGERPYEEQRSDD